MSGQTVKHVHRLLFTVWRWAEKKSFVAQNQMRLVDAPEAQASPGRSLDPEEAVLVLQAARGTRWEAFVLLAMISGARRGELLAIRWNAIDINGQSMTIRSNLIVDRRNGSLIEKSPKGGRSRTIPLSNQAVDALRQLRDSQSAEKKTAGKHYVDRGFVFADELGYPRHPDAVTKAYTVIRKRAGTPHSRLHDLRHSMASWALAGGSDLHTVQMLLGHSAPSTTANVYGHVIAGRERSATDAVTSALARGRMALEAKVVRESLPQSGRDGQILGQVALMKRGADTAKRQKNQ